MASRLLSVSFRIAVSLTLTVLPGYILFILLRSLGLAVGVDLIGGTIDTLINTHLPLLTTASDWIKQHPAWSPFFAIWGALAVTAFKVWSQRIEFFAISAQDARAMQPRSKSKGHEGIVPWVEPPERFTSGDGVVPELASHKSWAAQRKATEVLLTWIREGSGDGRWGRFWPRQPTAKNTAEWTPLKLALLTGENGVGKSALVDALGERLASVHVANSAKTDADSGATAKLRQLRAAAGAWSRSVLPWMRRKDDDPWDVGVLTPGDELQLAALRTWEPRRPTLFVIDEPDAGASQALKILEGRRDVFWHPVRLLVIDQAFPPALDEYVPSPAAERLPALALEYSKDLDLGDLRLDEGAIRGMWLALCEEQRLSWTARPSDGKTHQPDFRQVSKKLWRTEDVRRVLRLSDGNPLHAALALAELVGTSQSVSEICHAAGADPVSMAMEEEAGLQDFAGLDRSRMHHRMIVKRASDLVGTYEGILQRQVPNFQHDAMLAIAAATATGGLVLPPALSARLNAAALANLFPASARSASAERVWIPPVRPTVIGRAFLEAWIGSRVAPEALAREVAAFAWQHNPEGALRGLHQGHHLPDMIRRALARLAGEQAQRLPWAQGCCAALLCNDAEAEPFVAALEALSSEELETLDPWCKDRLAVHYPRRPDPAGALVAIAHVAARRAAKTTGGLSKIDIEAEIKTFAHWSALAGNTATHRMPRRRALASALAALLKTLTESERIDPAAAGELGNELLIACHDKGRETKLAACRSLTRYARKIASASRDTAADTADPKQPLRLARAWRLTCRAASPLGGERALALAEALAQRVEAIVTAHADFAAHAGLQQERAAAWRYAAYAASLLGGERALALAEALAQRVEAIVTAHADFAAHAGLQRGRAVAWRYAAYAASPLGGERALALAEALAQRVEAIVTAHADFAAHAGLQQERAAAWQHAAYAASLLGGERALALAEALAQRVEAIVTAHADFAAHAGLQEERATAWRYAAYAASPLGGERALALAEALAQRVEAIVTAHADFAAHAGLQQERATAWRHAAYAAGLLGGERALALAEALAQRVEAIVTAHADFAAHAGLQEERATAWRYAAYAASPLGGERALALAEALAQRVEAIVTAHADFAAHAGLQRGRAVAWRYAAYAASPLGGERALALAEALAQRVEAIVTAHADFAAHAGLQQERAAAWRYAAYAASLLGGERALALAEALAQRVEAIVTAHADFAAHAGLQQERAVAWRHAAYAASLLGGERALALAEALAQRVEAIVTAHADFAAHAGLQEERATAWRYAAYAASLLGGERGRSAAMAAAQRIREIVFATKWNNPGPFQREWTTMQSYLAKLGVSLTDRLHIELAWAMPAPASPASEVAAASEPTMNVQVKFDI